MVAADGALSGTINMKGVLGTMAHVHMGARGVNGPVIISSTKTSDGIWSVPAGTTLNTDRLTAYKAGSLYVNVHTDANKGGEVRAQLLP